MLHGINPNQGNTVKNKTWSRTKVQGLLRHRGGEYYARLYVSGKEKWVHLKTQHLEVAKARIEEEKKAIAAARKVGWAVKKGAVPVNEAVKAYKEHLRLRVGLKESTRHYYGWVLKAILKSWPELLDMEIPSVTENDCKEWARRFSKEYSPLYYNTAVLILNELFKMAIKTGAIYRNPAEGIELRKKPQRKLELPTREQFRQVVDFVATGKHRTAKFAANLIEFLAYTGCRISEAQRVTWSDCDLERGTLTIKGDAETATKNWKIRHIPLIPDAKKLLERLHKDRLELKPENPIMLVGDVRGAFKRAADEMGITLTHHSLRHLFATTCIEAGVDIPTVSRWLGHSDGGVLALKTYGHLRDEHSKRSAQLVSFAVFPQPAEAIS